MKLWENFSGYNLKERLEKAVRAEELVYPLRLVDVSLRTFQIKHLRYLDIRLHYWEMIQIHEFLNDFQVLPETYDDTIWYQYISAYLLLPKMEQFIEINSSAWNDDIKDENEDLIEEAVKIARSSLNATSLKNKIAEQISEQFGGSVVNDEINGVFSRKELSYPLNLLGINLRRLETEIQYWNIKEIHETLKYEGVLPAKYNYNLWYRYIAAYILSRHLNIKDLIELNKNGWSDLVRGENEVRVLNLDVN